VTRGPQNEARGRRPERSPSPRSPAHARDKGAEEDERLRPEVPSQTALQLRRSPARCGRLFEASA
jgi:hypothetical protein